MIISVLVRSVSVKFNTKHTYHTLHFLLVFFSFLNQHDSAAQNSVSCDSLPECFFFCFFALFKHPDDYNVQPNLVIEARIEVEPLRYYAERTISTD